MADNHCAAASAGTVSVCNGVCFCEDQLRRQEESDTLGVEYIGGVVFAYWLVGLN